MFSRDDSHTDSRSFVSIALAKNKHRHSASNMNGNEQMNSKIDKELHRMIGQYNLGNMIRALADPSFNNCGLEVEVGKELARAQNIKPSGILVPFEVINRALSVGSAGGSTGGKLVATNLLSNNFVDMLRPVSIVANLGATTLSGLVGNIQVPRQSASSTAYWLAENGAPPESAASFDQIPMTPHTLAAYSDISRKMLLQSSIDVSSFVAADLRASLGQELDRVCLAGSAANQPTGILSVDGIHTIEAGENGGFISYDDLVDMETHVANSNADGNSMAYVMTPKLRGYLAKTKTTTGEYLSPNLWTMAKNPSLSREGMVNGYRAIASTLAPSNLTKGTGTGLSSIAFGNWSDLLIGQWGAGIDLTIDPYALSTSGAVRIVAMTDVDVAIRHKESFVRIKDAKTE